MERDNISTRRYTQVDIPKCLVAEILGEAMAMSADRAGFMFRTDFSGNREIIKNRNLYDSLKTRFRKNLIALFHADMWPGSVHGTHSALMIVELDEKTAMVLAELAPNLADWVPNGPHAAPEDLFVFDSRGGDPLFASCVHENEAWMRRDLAEHFPSLALRGYQGRWAFDPILYPDPYHCRRSR